MNDSKTEAPGKVLVTANVLAAVASGVAAVLARRDPALAVDGSVTPIVNFYVEAYLVRALPISAVLIGLFATRRTAGLRPALLIAGFAQAGDVLVGAGHGAPGMIVGALVGAVVHLGSAWLLGRRR